jgi:hypothetical protein
MIMDSQSSVKPLLTTEAGISNTDAQGVALQRLAQYTICVGLGLLGGALGVALAIALTILINLLSPPSVIFAPGVIPLMAGSALAGVGVAWLLSQIVNFILPGLLATLNENGLRVILVFSILASLLQTILFFAPM